MDTSLPTGTSRPPGEHKASARPGPKHCRALQTPGCRTLRGATRAGDLQSKLLQQEPAHTASLELKTLFPKSWDGRNPSLLPTHFSALCCFWELYWSTVLFWAWINSDYFDIYYLVYPGRVLLSYLTTLIDSTSLNSSIAYQVTSLTRQAKCLEAIRVSFSVITSFFEKLLMRFFITQIIKRIFTLL